MSFDLLVYTAPMDMKNQKKFILMIIYGAFLK